MSFEEMNIVLKMRNNVDIKRWMYNQNDIDLDTHLKFINTLLFDISKQYFLIKKDSQYIGVVDFTNIDNGKKECDFGLYSNPFIKLAGVGRVLEEICIKYAFDILKLNKLKLEVFEENKQVRNLHKKYKFYESDKKIVNEKQVMCMELENENR
jgi:UDP-4-amino-4,6-dideoxy-N-acetyl-beta-L-altrosamine N-acetyltransferase